MQVNYLGKYKDLFDILHRSANAYSQVCKKEILGDSVKFSPYEVQIMECIFDNKDQNMKWYANRHGLSPSTYTKYIQKMVSKGLLEKYHVEGNKKNIILKVSELGMEEYEKYSHVAENWYSDIVDALGQNEDAAMDIGKSFLTTWGSKCYELVERDEEPKKYIRID